MVAKIVFAYLAVAGCLVVLPETALCQEPVFATKQLPLALQIEHEIEQSPQGALSTPQYADKLVVVINAVLANHTVQEKRAALAAVVPSQYSNPSAVSAAVARLNASLSQSIAGAVLGGLGGAMMPGHPPIHAAGQEHALHHDNHNGQAALDQGQTAPKPAPVAPVIPPAPPPPPSPPAQLPPTAAQPPVPVVQPPPSPQAAPQAPVPGAQPAPPPAQSSPTYTTKYNAPAAIPLGRPTDYRLIIEAAHKASADDFNGAPGPVNEHQIPKATQVKAILTASVSSVSISSGSPACQTVSPTDNPTWDWSVTPQTRTPFELHFQILDAGPDCNAPAPVTHQIDSFSISVIANWWQMLTMGMSSLNAFLTAVLALVAAGGTAFGAWKWLKPGAKS